VLFNMASIGTLGIYRHHEPQSDASMAILDQQRRAAWLKLQPKSLPPGQDAEVAKRKTATLPATGMLQ
jgi:hypothetical protein